MLFQKWEAKAIELKEKYKEEMIKYNASLKDNAEESLDEVDEPKKSIKKSKPHSSPKYSK